MKLDMSPRCVSVVLHDAIDANLRACKRLMSHLRDIASGEGIELPVTLLVTPMFYGREPSTGFFAWLREQSAAGHEIALHGYTQRVERGPEFARLDRREADWRVQQAREWAMLHRLPVRGFVAPEWAMSRDSFNAVEAAGFHYTCTRNEVIALPSRQRLHVHGLAFDARSSLHRTASIAANKLWAKAQRANRLMRFELKPADVDHENVLRSWRNLLAEALDDGRLPLRMDDAARHFCGAAPSFAM